MNLIKSGSPVAVDLFAGVGGTSEGARLAGVHVKWAANHWPLAVHYHQVNHPHVDQHACQDVHQADWSAVPAHDIQLASPACSGHSPARGKDLPHHDTMRSTAWAVVSCAEYHRSEVVIVENVKAFLAVEVADGIPHIGRKPLRSHSWANGQQGKASDGQPVLSVAECRAVIAGGCCD